MRPAGIEGHHHLGLGIAGIELGDLHAHRRHAKAGLSRKLGDLLVVGEGDDDRRVHGVAVLVLLLGVAQNRPHRALRDLLRHRIAFVLVVILVVVLAAARLDLGRIVLAGDIGRLEIFRVGLLDGLGKARGRIGGGQVGRAG